MIGELLDGRYEITEKLAQDRWSQTYLAKDTKRVGHPTGVVKQLHPENFDPTSIETAFRLFQEQAEILKQLGTADRLPHIWAFFSANDRFYLVQEFIEGWPLLDELLPGHPLTEQQAIAILVDLLEILEFIHGHQVIHGNLHPNNIIRRKKDRQLVVIDFAGVKAIINQPGAIASKLPGYQPSKQGLENAMFSSDVYAVGMIIIQSLTGISPQQLFRKPKNDRIIWPNNITVNRGLTAILNKMVSLKPKKRYFSTTKAFKDVQRWQYQYLSKQKQLLDSEPSHRGFNDRFRFRRLLPWNGIYSRTISQTISRTILCGFLGLLMAGSGITFLIFNPSALYFLFHPQIWLLNFPSADKIPLDILKLEIIQFDRFSRDRLIPDVVQQVNEIAAGITVRIDREKNNHGSGVIIAQTGTIYYVLTAKHVVGKQADYWVMTPDGERYRVNDEKVRKFAGVDLAILQFTSDQNYSVATLGNYQLKPDEMRWVFLSGTPILPDKTSYEREFNTGKVFSHEIGLLNIADADALNRGYELLYTNFSKAGMSGGPVLDTQGRVIGIHGASRVDRVSKVQLGESLGVPIQRFLGLDQLAEMPSGSLKVETSPPSELTPQENVHLLMPTGLNVNKPTQVNNYRSWVNYGNQLWRMGFNQEAIQAFDRSVKIQPDFYPAWYLRGSALKQEERYPEALASFKQVMKIQPKLYQVWREQGEVFARLEDYPKALKSIDRGLQLNSQDFMFHWLRGNWLYQSKSYVKAIEAYSSAIQIKAHPFAYYNRGVARYFLKDYSGAIADYDTAIEKNLKLGELYLGRGFAYFAQGKQPKAIEDLEKAEQLFCEANREPCEKIPAILKQISP